MKKLWKKALRKTFGLQAGKTTYALGKWLHNKNSNWRWFYKAQEEALFLNSDQGWQHWTRDTNRGRRGRLSKFRYNSQCISKPTDIRKATVTHTTGGRVIFTGSAECMEDAVTMHSSKIKFNEVQLDIQDDNLSINNFISALQEGKAKAVCDGSYFPEEQVGAAAWVFEEDITDTSISGAMPVVGQKEEQNPCRSETMGIYCVLLHLLQICQQHRISKGNITIYCDGLSAIQQLQYYSPDNFSTGKNFNIYNAIVETRKMLPISIEYKHIKGHQDKGTAYSSLSRIAQLNVLVDHLAKRKAKSIIQTNMKYDNDSLPLSPCDIFINTKLRHTIKINDSLSTNIRKHITGDTIQTYWIQKHKLQTTHKKIDWSL